MKAQIILSLASAATCLANTYQLHEWGTFTTVAGSDGVLLEGLQREEERLPPFVYSHFGMENDSPRLSPRALGSGRWHPSP
jgi:hypothetical protein